MACDKVVGDTCAAKGGNTATTASAAGTPIRAGVVITQDSRRDNTCKGGNLLNNFALCYCINDSRVSSVLLTGAVKKQASSVLNRVDNGLV